MASDSCTYNRPLYNERQGNAMTQSVATETLRPIQVPSPGSWTADTAHTSVGFVARHLVFSKVRGQFDRYEVDVTIGDTPEDSSVLVTIEAASINTGEARRDEHLRSPDFLDVERYPAITFASTSVKQVGGSNLRIHGDLTIRDTSRQIVLDAEFSGLVSDPWGNKHAIFEAGAELDREDFGITWNQALETGGVLVGKKVSLAIDVQLLPKA